MSPDPVSSGFPEPPLCILGPTASGKSSLALAIAERVEGVELVSIDSMQVYRGMDIGTAKPTAAEQEAVTHHLIDIADPADDFAVSSFRRTWREVAADMAARGAIPVLVGGTGLYLRAVIDDLSFPGQYPDAAAALGAEGLTNAELFARLSKLDPLGASRIDANNERRLLRALEVTIGSGQPFSSFGPGMTDYPDTEFRLLVLRMDKELVIDRINARYDQQMIEGFLPEVEALLSRERPIGRAARQALGYRELLSHLEDGVALDDALETARVRTRRFARRQMKWFERDPRIQWAELDESTPSTSALDQALSLMGVR